MLRLGEVRHVLRQILTADMPSRTVDRRSLGPGSLPGAFPAGALGPFGGATVLFATVLFATVLSATVLFATVLLSTALFMAALFVTFGAAVPVTTGRAGGCDGDPGPVGRWFGGPTGGFPAAGAGPFQHRVAAQPDG